MIIDAHAHLGDCRVTDLDVPEALLLSKMDENGVTAAIVQPFPGAPNPASVHDRIAALAESHPGRIYGLASLSPHRDAGEYRAEVTRCVRELGFVGVKLHTLGHAVNPMTRDGDLVCKTAQELGIPVMVHTGPGVPYALPTLIVPLARRYPDVTFVMAHAGWGIFSGEAVVVAQECPNVYLEPSWCMSTGILGMVRGLGAQRVMFGADGPLNQCSELSKFRSVGLTDEELAACLATTATTVFNLQGLAE